MMKQEFELLLYMLALLFYLKFNSEENMTNQKKILFLTNLPSPYMVDYFNMMSKKSNFKVIYERKFSGERPKSWNTSNLNHNFIFLRGLNFSKNYSFAPQVIFSLRGEYDSIIVSNPISPTGSIAILFMKLIKKSYYIYSEGGFVKSESFITSIIKNFILKDANLYLSGCEEGDAYFIRYGAPTSRIVRIPFSSVNENQIFNNRNFIPSSKTLLGKKNILAVGRFIPSKNFRWLIESWKKIDSSHHLYIVGEGPLLDDYKSLIFASHLNNVHILDTMNHNDLLMFMSQFDLLVHPTLSDVWGLVVNEAFSQGLPVITTPFCLAGVQMVENGVNGYIAEPNDVFIDNIISLISNDELIEKMRSNNLEKIKGYTIESMVLSTLDIVNANS